jgi:leucyl/phenylalanyl-tRNA--protein transferase
MTDITPDLVLKAYAYGVFPMAKSRGDTDVFWVQPKLRGVLPLEAFHVPRSLRKRMRQGVFTVTIDKDFTGVMAGCAESTEVRADTWINDRIIQLFTELYHAGLAHSVEVWQDGKLVGGLYGLAMGAAFFGESMFSRATDASKVALTHLAGILIKGGFTLLDTQFITDHLKRFGAIEISQQDYLTQLGTALTRQGRFEEPLSQRELEAALLSHRNTQTS